MQRIIIENFGPIQHLDLEIKDLSLFIGEQATGKSTVAKLIYFFKSLRGDLIDYLYYQSDFEGDDIFQLFIKDIQHKFSNKLFGYIKNTAPANLTFQYGNNKYLSINLNSNPITVTFSDSKFVGNKSSLRFSFGRDLFKICNDIKEYRQYFFNPDKVLLHTTNTRNIEYTRRSEATAIEKHINSFFEDDKEIQFIPAGRSILSILSGQLTPFGFDFFMTAFSKQVDKIKPAFNQQPIEELIKSSVLENKNPNYKEALNLAIQKVKTVLKGEYGKDRIYGDGIYLDDETYVKLSMASSGQQEAVWILMQTFVLLLNREKVFLVIEEPEAHLSPEAQKSVVELITLLLKENESQVLITTHSPYILTAFNNLIYAGNVGKEHAKEVGKIIPPELWIDSEQVGAYKLRGGTSEDLMDHETMLIRAEELDSVSRSINEAFDAILNLELQ